MKDLVFDRSLVPHYGVVERLSPRIARLLAPNPGPFTFKGTGVYIVGSGQAESVAVIDPGPDMPVHVEALRRALEGRKVGHILITHTHRDHSPAAAGLKRLTGAPTLGFGPHPSSYPLRPSHLIGATATSPASDDARGRGGSVLVDEARTEESGDRNFVPDITVRDGDVIAGDGYTLECVHTPGHISNHMCYALKEENALFTGDHVMGWSTSVVAPPDGNMADYIASLEKLMARDDAIFYPTHGSPIVHPGPFLRGNLTHRRMRAAQIRDSIARGRDTVAAMVERLYPDISPELRTAASSMVRAHLEQMRDEGHAEEQDGRWRLTG